jgi:hypothetical protein
VFATVRRMFPGLMSVPERRDHLEEDPGDPPELLRARESAARREDRFEGDPFEVVHREEEPVPDRPDIAEGDDVGVVEALESPDLTLEAPPVGRIDRARQRLQGDPPPAPEVLGEPDDTHPPLADRRQEAVAVVDHLLPLEGVGHLGLRRRVDRT